MKVLFEATGPSKFCNRLTTGDYLDNSVEFYLKTKKPSRVILDCSDKGYVVTPVAIIEVKPEAAPEEAVAPEPKKVESKPDAENVRPIRESGGRKQGRRAKTKTGR